MKIIKISALWCPACLITNKAIDKIKEEQNIEVENLDYDFDEDEVKKYNVGTTLPVLIFMDQDKELFRLIGEKNYEEIMKRTLDLLLILGIPSILFLGVLFGKSNISTALLSKE